MKFALAGYGTRGDVEPVVTVARELQRRGHGVRMAVPPDLVGFAEDAGLAEVSPLGMRVDAQLDAYRDMWSAWARHFWRVQDLVELCRAGVDSANQQWVEVSTTLASLAEHADVLATGVGFEESAANVAEFHDIPYVALHTMPWRPNGQLFPLLPARVTHTAMTAYDWIGWRLTKRAEDRQRRELGLPKATTSPPRRMARHGRLEIQAYDAAAVPGLAAEWAALAARRPFVGALTMGLTTDSDDEVTSWIAAGSPPIGFALGSVPVQSPSETVEMIASACALLGERALVCAGGSDTSGLPDFDHVKVVGMVNYGAVFPACRAIVHHGGSGTTAASLRAGVPTLILWTVGDQPLWGNQIKRLKVGAARRSSTTTRDSLVADLRTILTPNYAARARNTATRMTKPGESVSRAADLMERAAAGQRHTDTMTT